MSVHCRDFWIARRSEVFQAFHFQDKGNLFREDDDFAQHHPEQFALGSGEHEFPQAVDIVQGFDDLFFRDRGGQRFDFFPDRGQHFSNALDLVEVCIFVQRLLPQFDQPSRQPVDVLLVTAPEILFPFVNRRQGCAENRRGFENVRDLLQDKFFKLAAGDSAERALMARVLVRLGTDIIPVFPAMPFAALTGYEAAVGETARLTSERRELDPQEAEELNRRLTELAARLPDHPEMTVEYFVPDDRKAGGAYVTVTGRVRHISVPEKTLVLEDGAVISLEDVDSVVF